MLEGEREEEDRACERSERGRRCFLSFAVHVLPTNFARTSDSTLPSPFSVARALSTQAKSMLTQRKNLTIRCLAPQRDASDGSAHRKSLTFDRDLWFPCQQLNDWHLWWVNPLIARHDVVLELWIPSTHLHGNRLWGSVGENHTGYNKKKNKKQTNKQQQQQQQQQQTHLNVPKLEACHISEQFLKANTILHVCRIL